MAERPVSVETSLLRQNPLQQQDHRFIKRHPKILQLVLITVISLAVAIAAAVLVVIPYQHTGSAKPHDLYSRLYTLGDTSLTTVNTTLCSHASMDLYGNLSNIEVRLDAFPDGEKLNLTSQNTLGVEYQSFTVPNVSNKLIMNTYLHPGSYANILLENNSSSKSPQPSAYFFIFLSELLYDQWIQTGNFGLAYKCIFFDIMTCPCHWRINYTIESDYYHVIATTDLELGDLDIGQLDIVVTRTQYKIPNSTHGCIVNASSTSCEVSTKPDTNLAVEVNGSGTAEWNKTVNVSLRCVPMANDGLYAGVGVSVAIGVFLLVWLCIGLSILIVKKGKGMIMRSHDPEPNGQRGSLDDDSSLNDGSVSPPGRNRAPDDGDIVRVMDNDAFMPPLGYSAVNDL